MAQYATYYTVTFTDGTTATCDDEDLSMLLDERYDMDHMEDIWHKDHIVVRDIHECGVEDVLPVTTHIVEVL